MAKRDSLENYALFYERIDTKHSGDSQVKTNQINNSKNQIQRPQKKEDLSKLSEDLRSPMQHNSQTNPLR